MKRLLTATFSAIALSVVLVPGAKAINQVERLQLLPQIAYPVTTIQPGQTQNPSPQAQPQPAPQTMQSEKSKSVEIESMVDSQRPSFEYFEDILRERYGN